MKAAKSVHWVRLTRLTVLSLVALASCIPSSTSPEPLQFYRGIYFGKTQEQVNRALQRDSKFDCDICKVQAETKLNGISVSITMRYFEDKLYKVYFSGDSFPIASTRLDRELSALTSFVQQHYNAPTSNLELNARAIEPGGIQLRHLWDTPENPINISVGIGRYDTEYYAVLVAEYKPLVTAYNALVSDN